MRLFKISGKAEKVSKEQVRAFLHASLTILTYHNLIPVAFPLTVQLKKNLKDMGDYCGGRIRLRSSLEPEEMLTTVLHETIHACVRFPHGQVEKCTSTLCSRLKPDVAKMAAILLEGTYQRAAFIAHTKLSYRPAGEDHYDEAEDVPLGVQPRYLKSIVP